MRLAADPEGQTGEEIACLQGIRVQMVDASHRDSPRSESSRFRRRHYNPEMPGAQHHHRQIRPTALVVELQHHRRRAGFEFVRQSAE